MEVLYEVWGALCAQWTYSGVALAPSLFD